MCGRYASSRSPDQLAFDFAVEDVRVEEDWAPDFNVAPTKDSPVVVARLPKGASEDATPVRQLRTLRWGLVPSWAKDPRMGGRMINARGETVHEKPAYRRAFAARRCLVPVDGFYEWFPTRQLSKSGKPVKQPFYLHPREGVLALAGVYEFWRDPVKPADDPDRWLVTFAIMTTRATDDLGHIHDRMPMTVTSDHWDDWLDPRLTDPDQAREFMAAPEAGTLRVYAVSTLVNDANNNGPELLEPLPMVH